MSLGSVRFLTSNIFLPVSSASVQENSWPSGFTKHFLIYKDEMYYLEQLELHCWKNLGHFSIQAISQR